MSDLQYVEISMPSTPREQADSVLSGSPIPLKVKRVRQLNPRIKEWKICEVCGRSFYRTEGSKRKYCARQDCAPNVLCLRLCGPREHDRGRKRRPGQQAR